VATFFCSLDRLLPGRWEGDFIKRTGNRFTVGTPVDQHSLFVCRPGWMNYTALAVLAGSTTAFAPPELQ
jgi:hypothetical protein